MKSIMMTTLLTLLLNNVASAEAWVLWKKKNVKLFSQGNYANDFFVRDWI